VKVEASKSRLEAKVVVEPLIVPAVHTLDMRSHSTTPSLPFSSFPHDDNQPTTDVLLTAHISSLILPRATMTTMTTTEQWATPELDHGRARLVPVRRNDSRFPHARLYT